jgi:ribosomal protein S18 acetylase RimI-like enzyme
MGLSIRAFRNGDRAAVEALWTRVFPDDPPRNAPALMIENKLEVQPELLLVGEVDGVDAAAAAAGGAGAVGAVGARIVGAVMAGYDGVRGWIYHLAVAPEFRRRGYGAQLVRAAEAGLRTLGCAKVNLQVRASNREVIAFYRSVGYEVEERVSMGRRI